MGTKEEWWSAVDNNWNYLLEIIYAFAPDRADEATTCMLERNPDLARSLNAAWYSAPDDRSVLYSYPCWGLLCDLCSEEWVLYE